jgi:tetratricopeptide (TPR) repeat protein
MLEEDIVILSSSDTDLPSIDFEEPDDEIIENKPEPTAPALPEVPAEKQQTSGESVADQLKRLLYDIKIRKAVNDKEGTISLLYEVVALMPQSAKYEAMLAEALASHSVLSKKAERHFRRALSLEPQSADLHFRMGRYYQSFNMKSRAVAEFKTTLRIDPRHSKARGALVELNESSDKPVGQLFKKIFG